MNKGNKWLCCLDYELWIDIKKQATGNMPISVSASVEPEGMSHGVAEVGETILGG